MKALLFLIVGISFPAFAQNMTATVWDRPNVAPIAEPRLYYRPVKDPNFAFFEIVSAATGWESVSGFSIVQLQVKAAPGAEVSDENLQEQKLALARANRFTITYYMRGNTAWDTLPPLDVRKSGETFLLTLPNEDATIDGYIEINAFEEKDGSWISLGSGRTALDSASPGLFKVSQFPYHRPAGFAVLEDGSHVSLSKALPRTGVRFVKLFGTGILGPRCDRRASAHVVAKGSGASRILRSVEIKDVVSKGVAPGYQSVDVKIEGEFSIPEEGYVRLQLKIEGCGEQVPGGNPQFQSSNDVDLIFEGAQEKIVDNKNPEIAAEGFSTEGRVPTSPSQNISAVARYAQTSDKWSARKVALRNQFLNATHLNPLPQKTPLYPALHTGRQRDGYMIQNVSFESTPGFLVTGNLYRPLGRFGARPAVLLTHGHFDAEASAQGGYSPRTMRETQVLAARLAQAGAVVFAYDMVGYGDSQQQVKHSVKNAMQLQTWNSVRAIDFLETLTDDFGRPLVDPARIGITGASGGATQGLFAQIIDERISAFVPVVMIAAGYRGGGEVCEEGMPVHSVPGQERANNTELAAMMAPRPTLFISDGDDWTKWFHTEEFGYVQHIYGLSSAQNMTSSRYFPHEGHDYGPSKRKAAYEFFEKYYGLEELAAKASADPVLNPEAVDIQRNASLKAISQIKRRIVRPMELLK